MDFVNCNNSNCINLDLILLLDFILQTVSDVIDISCLEMLIADVG